MNQLASLFAQFGIQHFLERTQTLIALIDFDGKLQEWNPAFDGVKARHPQVESIQGLLAPSCHSIFSDMIRPKELRQASLEFNSGLKMYSFECLLVPVENIGFLFFAQPDYAALDEKITRIINELKKTKRALKLKKIDLESVIAQANEISHTDALTFLPNRRQIVADLQRSVALCDQQQTPLTIFMLDIDHFKQVNDTYGHAAGDRVLKAMASRLFESFREDDEVGRYGGEEFIILLPGTTEKSASKIAERILSLIRELNIEFDEKVLKITVSIGIAQYRIGEESWDELLNRADQAMYQSKQNGRDQWTISETSQT